MDGTLTMTSVCGTMFPVKRVSHFDLPFQPSSLCRFPLLLEIWRVVLVICSNVTCSISCPLEISSHSVRAPSNYLLPSFLHPLPSFPYGWPLSSFPYECSIPPFHTTNTLLNCRLGGNRSGHCLGCRVGWLAKYKGKVLKRWVNKLYTNYTRLLMTLSDGREQEPWSGTIGWEREAHMSSKDETSLSCTNQGKHVFRNERDFKEMKNLY